MALAHLLADSIYLDNQNASAHPAVELLGIRKKIKAEVVVVMMRESRIVALTSPNIS
jgi:hypothetical protein